MSEVVKIKREKEKLPGEKVRVVSVIEELFEEKEFEELINLKKRRLLELKSQLRKDKIRADIEVKIDRKDSMRIHRLKDDLILAEMLKVKEEAEENIPNTERELKVLNSELECLEEGKDETD